MPDCYIIAGPNGAGKSTFATEFLPNHAMCLNFINPDLIARGLSPFNPDLALVRAGRLVIEQIKSRVANQETFGFETTLAGRTYLPLVKSVSGKGYDLHMFYLWIASPELGLQRIRQRVEAGGHNVPEPDVRRRYPRSLTNLLTKFREHLTTLHFFDNSTSDPHLVFHDDRGKTTILDKFRYNEILTSIEIGS